MSRTLANALMRINFFDHISVFSKSADGKVQEEYIGSAECDYLKAVVAGCTSEGREVLKIVFDVSIVIQADGEHPTEIGRRFARREIDSNAIPGLTNAFFDSARKAAQDEVDKYVMERFGVSPQ